MGLKVNGYGFKAGIICGEGEYVPKTQGRLTLARAFSVMLPVSISMTAGGSRGKGASDRVTAGGMNLQELKVYSHGQEGSL